MAYTDGIIVNEEFMKAHPEIKCEADDSPIEIGNCFAELTTDWEFADRNCVRKWDVDLNVTKDVAKLYE